MRINEAVNTREIYDQLRDLKHSLRELEETEEIQMAMLGGSLITEDRVPNDIDILIVSEKTSLDMSKYGYLPVPEDKNGKESTTYLQRMGGVGLPIDITIVSKSELHTILEYSEFQEFLDENIEAYMRSVSANKFKYGKESAVALTGLLLISILKQKPYEHLEDGRVKSINELLEYAGLTPQASLDLQDKVMAENLVDQVQNHIMTILGLDGEYNSATILDYLQGRLPYKHLKFYRHMLHVIYNKLRDRIAPFIQLGVLDTNGNLITRKDILSRLGMS